MIAEELRRCLGRRVTLTWIGGHSVVGTLTAVEDTSATILLDSGVSSPIGLEGLASVHIAPLLLLEGQG